MWFDEKLKQLNFSSERAREFAVQAMKTALNNISNQDDQYEVVMWLTHVREILSDKELSKIDAAKKIFEEIDTRQTVQIIGRSLQESFANYKYSKLPFGLKFGIPAAGIAVAMLGPAAVGIAGFGGAVGLPVALLVFVGVTGIATILESFIKDKDLREDILKILMTIATDESIRRTEKAFREAMRRRPDTPCRVEFDTEEADLKWHLQGMDPHEFERHVMSFFEARGFKSAVTQASNDYGLDGWAIDPENGLIVVQCKRNSDRNKVGRPVVQQFWGVIEQQKAYKGYIVTTSTFTTEAIETAKDNPKIELVGIEELLSWHS